jgi:hypothetical protein
MVLIASKQLFVCFRQIFQGNKLSAPEVIRVVTRRNIIQAADLLQLCGAGNGLMGKDAIKGISTGQGIEEELLRVTVLMGNLIKGIVSVGGKDQAAGLLAGHPQAHLQALCGGVVKAGMLTADLAKRGLPCFYDKLAKPVLVQVGTTVARS